LAFITLTLSYGHQEWHLICKNTALAVHSTFVWNHLGGHWLGQNDDDDDDDDDDKAQEEDEDDCFVCIC